jgi:hypothetical protein
LRIQSLCLADRPYQISCLEPIENELKARGHSVIRTSEPLQKDGIDATLVSTYLYLRKGYFNKIKHPIFFSEHGVAVVKEGFRPLYHTKADYMMQSGPIWHERALFRSPKYKSNLTVGYPKSDELFNNINNSAKIREEVVKELFLDPNEPIIVFAPTWYDPDGYNPGSTILLDEIESMGFKNIITCFHDFDLIGKKKTGPRYIKTSNKNRYLLAADLMIGDFSSIVIEFAVLNRPIVQVNPFDTLDHFYIWREKDYGLFQIGDIVGKGGIKAAVKKALEDPKQYEFLRKYWVKRSFYNLGRAAKVAVDQMEALTK